MFLAQSTTRGYIRTEGDFHGETYSWKDRYKAEIRPEEQWENGPVVGRLYGMKYSSKGNGDRNIQRIEFFFKIRSEQVQLVHIFDINRNIPTKWRWARGDIIIGASRADTCRHRITTRQNAGARMHVQLWLWRQRRGMANIFVPSKQYTIINLI